MNFLAICMLCIMIFVILLINKHEVLNEETIYNKYYNEKDKTKLKNRVDYIYKNTEKLNIPISQIKDYDFSDIDSDKYYIITDNIKADSITIADKKNIVLNFINKGEKICIFDSKYTYKGSLGKNSVKSTIKRYIILATNYVQFFIKKDIIYSEVIFTKGSFLKNIKQIANKDIVFFGPSDIIIEDKEDIKSLNSDIIKSKYGILNFITIILSMLIGTIVTSNLLYNVFSLIFNMNMENLKNVIFAVLIYYCYMGVNNVIYKPIGQLKFIASVFFYAFCLGNLTLSIKKYVKGDNMKKSGVTLLILAVTIGVLMTLTGIVISVGVHDLHNVYVTRFMEKMGIVNDAVYGYYTSKCELPVTTDVYTVDDLSSLSQNSSELIAKITSNNDVGDEFYKIDNVLLGVIDSRTYESIDPSDVYVIDDDMENIYYVYGEKIGDQYYFCLEMIAIEQNMDTANNKNTHLGIVSTTTSIKVVKNTTEETSKLEINISTTLNDGETLQYTIGDVTQNLSEPITMINVPADVIVSLTQAQLTSFITAFNAEPKITVNKVSNGSVIATSVLSLENLNLQ